MKGLKLIAIACVASLVSLLASCSRQSGSANTQFEIAVIPQSTGGEFWETVEKGARRAAEEVGVRLRWEGTVTETEVAEQNKIIENMINLGVDGIAVAPQNSRGTRAAVRNAVTAGIPVVAFDSEVEGNAHTSFVATDNRKGGEIAARRLRELLNGENRRVFAMRYIQGSSATEERIEGFAATAKEVGLRIESDPYPDSGTVEGCKTAAANNLERHIRNGRLEIDGIFAANLYTTLGVLFALEDIQRTGVKVDVCFVGFDTSPRLVRELLEGRIDALVVQNAETMGYLAVKTVYRVIRGETVDKVIDTGVELVTAQRWKDEPAIRSVAGSPDTQPQNK